MKKPSLIFLEVTNMTREDDTRDLPLHEDKEWNVYNESAREELVESDSLNPEEEAFMRGYYEEG
jgi:hypothetical protein